LRSTAQPVKTLSRFKEELMAWHHSGFSVHAGNQIARDYRDTEAGKRMSDVENKRYRCE
jgi:hypothetical protein